MSDTDAPAEASGSAASASNSIWVSVGPAPGINGQETVLPNNQINGAIQAIAVDPTNANIMYVGSVNGGIWKTTNALLATPHWIPLTDNLPSLSIGALEFDPTDATRQTLIAGIGATSSYRIHDTGFSGVLRTTDGGATWSQLGTVGLAGQVITSVAARGSILLAAADNGWSVQTPGSGDGLFRSTDSGATWVRISDGTHGLPNLTDVSDIVGDPLNSNVFYAAVTGASGGIFRSTDSGLTWTNITAGIGIISASTQKIELAVHHDATNLDIYASIVTSGVMNGVYRSLNGASFAALDVPTGGVQGDVHNAIAVDPSNHNIVYVGLGGGSTNYLTRIDASKASGSQITRISGGTFGSPHVDTREMQIDANGNLILSTDGGIFRLPTPTTNSGVWSAITGDISVFEIHSIAYDHVSHVIMAGAQDNGTLFQQAQGGTTWDHPGFGDGGDVVVDDVSLAASGQSIRYFSSQNLGGWTRQVYNSANQLVSTTNLSVAPVAPDPDGDDDEDEDDEGGEPAIADPSFTTPVELDVVDPSRILVGGTGHLYQFLNQGTTLTSIGTFAVNGIGFNGGGLMVYGGYQNGIGNADLIYVASGNNILRQTTSGGGFTTTSPGGSTIRGVTDNPSNWAKVYAIDDNQIFASTNGGATWTDVTTNLTSISAADFRSVEYVRGPVDDALVVGTSSGAFYVKVSSLGTATSWNRVGGNLPNVVVYDLDYDAVDNVLVAGTFGRGAWLVNNVTFNLGLTLVRPQDFNGDGTSDILLQDGSGNLADWTMQNGVFSAGYSVGNPATYGFSAVKDPFGLKTAITGDFNGDGTSDVLLQDGNGYLVDWSLNNGVVSASYGIGNATTYGYNVVGTGDFNGDGTTDILLQDGNGYLVDWSLNNGVVSSSYGIGNPTTYGFNVVGTGDFNGDGTTDILLQDGTAWLSC